MRYEIKIEHLQHGGAQFWDSLYSIISIDAKGDERVVWTGTRFPKGNKQREEEQSELAKNKIDFFMSNDSEIQAEIQEIEDIKEGFIDYNKSIGGDGKLNINIH